MLSIAEYKPFFIKNTFNIPDNKPKYKKKNVIEYDPIFYAFFYELNNYDITHINFTSINYKTNEKQEKIKIAVEIEKMGKEKIKPKDKDDIIQNIMYDTRINLKTLNALCLFYKINLLYIKDNIFIKMCYGEKIKEQKLETETKTETGAVSGSGTETKTETVSDKGSESFDSNYLVMDTNRFVDLDLNSINSKYEVNLDKPLRCASYYKIDDLKKISLQLHLPFEHIKKQQLYASIQNVLNKLNI